jgi:hypothetical protein
MRVAHRKVAEDEPHGVAEFGEHMLQDQVGAAAVRAFVVAVLDEHDRGVGRAKVVILRTDRRVQLSLFHVRALKKSSCSR